MSRTNRIAIFAALALVVALAGTALGQRIPVGENAPPAHADEHETAPDDVVVERVADRLGVEASEVRELAAEHGFGTAVRLLAWRAEGVDMQQVLERRADGKGWGVIAKEFGVHPGIGSIVGNGGGHGRDNAPGQQKQGDDTDD